MRPQFKTAFVFAAGTAAAALLALPQHSADAASRQIRLTAHVPVFCALKSVAPYSNVFDRHGRSGPGKFRIVCNTAYRMHMDGWWDKPGWPHVQHAHDDHDKDHKKKTIDVDLHVTGGGHTRQASCAFVNGRDAVCRGFSDDDGWDPPPSRGVAQISVGGGAFARSFEHGRDDGHDKSHDKDRGPFSDRDRSDRASGRAADRWGGRMSLGGLPRIAAAGDLTYLPSFVTDASAGEAPPEAGDDLSIFDDGANENVTLFLTLTGRY